MAKKAVAALPHNPCGFTHATVLLIFGFVCCAAGDSASSIIVDQVRVQALSATLLRVEPEGPRGFEDRPTFMVLNRSFPGIPIWLESTSELETVVSTKYYKVHLQRNVGVYWEVRDPRGGLLYAAIDDISNANFVTLGHRQPNLLHWPAPLNKTSFALVDAPRFFAPAWGPTPIHEKVDPALTGTNGFDFRNNIDGDTYVFLLGKTLETWQASRLEFINLVGPCPLLPDYAYGLWFTFWHNYTQSEAKQDVEKWDLYDLPIDLWGMDMNWRNTTMKNSFLQKVNVQNSDGSDWYYDRPNTVLFPDYDSWFQFLRSKSIRTYFNDHPYPVAGRGAGGLQTSAEEVQFRWEGLTKWMKKGLSLWWFDRNWRFSIPPPFVNTSRTSASWEGLDNAAWGSYVYYKNTEVFKKQQCGDNCTGNDRPIALTKFAPLDWLPGIDAVQHQEHPSHHRYPVWWTGDQVPLQASVEAMVDSGLHNFKPFVHSDCGGDYRGSGGDYLRWVAHCVFSPIIRLHGADHRPWTYDDHVLSTAREYLKVRYKLLPSLIAAGHRATLTGFPLAARCDMFWPELRADSATNQQYVFLEDILVAPIWDQVNISTRQVWIPPGVWKDLWNGSTVHGPRYASVTQPFEKLPMWMREGGVIIAARQAWSRVQDQDWSTLVLELFMGPSSGVTKRTLFDRTMGHRTEITFARDFIGSANVNISTAEDGATRGWVLRFHLMEEWHAYEASIDGRYLDTKDLHLHQREETFPFSGPGRAPGEPMGTHEWLTEKAPTGPVVELYLPPMATARRASIRTRKEEWYVEYA